MQFQSIHSSEYSALDVLEYPFMKRITALYHVAARCLCTLLVEDDNAADGLMCLPVGSLTLLGLQSRQPAPRWQIVIIRRNAHSSESTGRLCSAVECPLQPDIGYIYCRRDAEWVGASDTFRISRQAQVPLCSGLCSSQSGNLGISSEFTGGVGA
jgi:hypothetical protein